MHVLQKSQCLAMVCFPIAYSADAVISVGRLKTRDLTSRDWTTRHHIARVDIARLVSLCEYKQRYYMLGYALR